MLKRILKGSEYKFKTIPLGHQLKTYMETRHLEYYAYFWEMGLGKSKLILDIAGYLYLQNEIDGLLILAPKGMYMNWFNTEVPAHLPDYVMHRSFYWETDANKTEERQARELLQGEDDLLDIMVMNVESLRSQRAVEFAHEFMDGHTCMVVVDESDCIKKVSGDQSKAVNKLGKRAAYRRILTGTPMTNGCLDLFAQCRFLKEGLLGFDLYVPFKNYYANVIRLDAGGRSYEKVLSYKNTEELSQHLSKFSSRLLKEECLDLPEKVFIDYEVVHTDEQRRAYEEFKKNALLMFGDDAMLSSTSVLKTMLKLHQINCGHVMDDDRTVRRFKSNRVGCLIDILSKINGKVIIWCNFREDVNIIMEALEEYHKGTSKYATTYYGLTTPEEGVENVRRFREDPDCTEFVSTLKKGARGITLVESSYAIYYSYNHELSLWLQSQDRNHRIGQKNAVTYVVMQTKKTVDTHILDNLKKKKNLADEVLDNWRLLFS